MGITVLHLSDVHLSSAKMKDFQFVRDALIKDIERTRREEKLSIDLVVFSGDLVQSGDKLENFFEAKAKLIDPELREAGLEYDRFFLCPGNHDINREDVRKNPEIEDGQKGLVNRARLNSFIDRHLSVGYDHHQFTRLTHFHSFRGTTVGTVAIRDNPFFATYECNINGERVGIAAFNTAWRATGEADDVDYGRLLLGERCVSEALQDIKTCPTKLAVLHHPDAWIREFDRNDCGTLLIRDFDLVLRGHMHRPKPESQRNPLGQAVFSEGGALYVNREYFNGYCFISLNRETNRVRFRLRRYEDMRQVFEKATNVAPDGEFEVEFATPNEADRLVQIGMRLRAVEPVLAELANEKMLSPLTDEFKALTFSEIYVEPQLSNKSSRDRISSPRSSVK